MVPKLTFTEKLVWLFARIEILWKRLHHQIAIFMLRISPRQRPWLITWITCTTTTLPILSTIYGGEWKWNRERTKNLVSLPRWLVTYVKKSNGVKRPTGLRKLSNRLHPGGGSTFTMLTVQVFCRLSARTNFFPIKKIIYQYPSGLGSFQLWKWTKRTMSCPNHRLCQ